MSDSFDIKARPQLPGTQQAALQVQARQQQWNGPAPADNADLRGLVEGLSSFNPALRQFATNEQQKQDEANRQAQQDAILAGRAAGQRQEDPVSALTGQPVDVPSNVPVAYGRDFRAAWSETTAQRAGVENKATAMEEYGSRKGTEGFDLKQWLGEQRQKWLQGVTDPRMAATIGAHFTEMQAEVSADAERDRRIRQDAERVSTASVIARDAFTADMSPDKMAEAYPLFQARIKSIGFDPKQAASFAFRQVQEQSQVAGGRPEMFDFFDKKMDNGLRLMDMNPELADHIAAARQHATQTRDKSILEAAEQGNGKVLDGIHSDILTNPFAVTEDRLMAHFTKYGAIQSPSQYASLMNSAREAQMKFMATQQLQASWDGHTLFRLEGGQQNKLMDANFKGAMDALVQANNQGDAATVAQIGARIFQVHSTVGATVPFDQLKGFIGTLTKNLQPKDGPTPAFNSAVELYKAMSGNPAYRDQYFDENTSKVLKGYIGATGNGTDSGAAYTQAFQSIDPAAQASAEAFTKTPAFQELVKKDAEKAVQGSSWWPRWLGGNGRPENTSTVGQAISQEMRDWRARNPNATDKDAEEFAQSWTQRNFVLDATTGSAVKVPPGLGGQGAQEALSAHSAEVAKRLQLGSRSDANWRVQYVPTGDQGDYMAVAFNGSASQRLGTVNLGQLQTIERAKKVLSDDERAQLGVMRQGIKDGNLPTISPELLAKASALGVLKPQEVKAYQDQAQARFMDRLTSIPSMSFGTPSTTNLQFPPQKGSMKVDNALTARTALDLMGSYTAASHGAGSVMNGGAMSGRTGADNSGLAASLITMGETVALKAYDDPAAGAGKNIGMGYNLKANAATVDADLKRAGVPPEAIEMVKNGTAELTSDQARRLLMVALPRYEKQVQDVAEASSPGLWNKMLPQQKAVMVDVAYQVGSTDKFKKAWAALASGDSAAFANEAKVFFTDRNGVRKEDTRRNNLRASMLAGLSHWEETVNTYGQLPSSKLQALAMK